MKFEILDSMGLAGIPLTGLIGHSILPNDYSINKNGQIHVGGKLLHATVQWDEHELCHHIGPKLVPIFLGHKVADYRVEERFDRFRPIAKFHENSSPK